MEADYLYGYRYQIPQGIGPIMIPPHPITGGWPTINAI